MRSAVHPVPVRAHYRAAWGSRVGRRGRVAAVVDAPLDPVDETIEDVVRAARVYRPRRRRYYRRARVYTTYPYYRRRRRVRRAVVAVPRRRNVYWVRDSVTGTRYPVTSRPAATTAGYVV